MTHNPWTNPVVPGFHPDPSICEVDGTYYLACSSFEYLPGLPLFTSTDLATWEPIGHVVTHPEQLASREIPTNGGAWAPTIRFHDGVFHVVVTDAMGRGNLLFTTTDPAGKWSEGTPTTGVDGIDPDLAWDAEGTCYLTYSGLLLTAGDGPRHLGIQQVRLDTETGAALEEPRSLWSGTGGIFPEAPHLYEIDGTWYLMVAEGGTERGHAISIARAPSPVGPFEGCPGNPLVTARGTDRPVQNTGHGDLFLTPAGEWAVVCLGVRPRGMVRSFSAMGRETFMTTARFGDDGWLQIDPVELDAPGPGVTLDEEFDEPALGLPWLTIRRPAAEFSSLTERAGWLVLTGDGATMDDDRPAWVGRRQQHEITEVTAVVDASQGVGGLSLRIDQDNHVDVEVDGLAEGGPVVRARGVVARLVQTWEAPAPAGPVTVRLTTTQPESGFSLRAVTSDIVTLSFDGPEGTVELGEVDGRTLSAEGAGSFTGRVVGAFAGAGTVAFDRVSYTGRDGGR
ncbi:glycoside hydrolase family 43 protein [Kineococcus sp. NBC_00420]|uniref:glycoside hydrolase family 43 protein n=1 Tax=Kineococcus sp. NBC_00420 TaxID=2903564 RepID=UPI002E1CED86